MCTSFTTAETEQSVAQKPAKMTDKHTVKCLASCQHWSTQINQHCFIKELKEARGPTWTNPSHLYIVLARTRPRTAQVGKMRSHLHTTQKSQLVKDPSIEDADIFLPTTWSLHVNWQRQTKINIWWDVQLELQNETYSSCACKHTSRQSFLVHLFKIVMNADKNSWQIILQRGSKAESLSSNLPADHW